MWLVPLGAVLLGAAAQASPAAGEKASPQPAPPISVSPTPAKIGYLTAGQLADRCSDNSAAGSTYCFAFITGVHDTVQAYEQWLAQREFCVPAGTPQADLRRSFLSYMLVYPQNSGGEAASVVVVALKAAYPCR